MVRGADGRPLSIEVIEVKENTVMVKVDANHPLAGKKLTFDVKVLKVENAPEKKVEMPAVPATPEAKPTK